MPVNRIYHNKALMPGDTVELDQRAAYHLRQVLRMRTGDAVTVFNDNGEEYSAGLRVEGKKVYAEIVRLLRTEPHPGLRVNLVQSISRGDRMDLSVQKAVELGVCRITPVYSGRSIKTLDGKRTDKKMQHWRGVVISACEQSGRCRLPGLDAPQTLTDYLNLRDRRIPGLILDPTADLSTPQALEPCDELDVLSGPEGGWTEQEVVAAVKAGVTAASLGPRILRTETAGLAALAVIQAQIGDMK